MLYAICINPNPTATNILRHAADKGEHGSAARGNSYSRLHKLIWSEGMYLAPHHFQAQARFFENSVRFLADSFWQYNYGFSGLEIDGEQLLRGSFAIHHIRGIMPDGLFFDVSKAGEAPALKDVNEIFPETGVPLVLFLSLRSYEEGRALVSSSNTEEAARFRPLSVSFPDLNSGQDLKAVNLLRPSFRILSADERGENDVSMPIARVLRDGKGEFLLDPEYAPPVLRTGASPYLQALLDRLVNVLSDKSRTLTENRRKGPASGLRGDPKELIEFWLLQSINSTLPVLQSWRRARSFHPYELYRELSKLAGSLCTFVANSSPATIPEYDHLALGECFKSIDQHIRQHLERNLPTNCLTIPLRGFQPVLTKASPDETDANAFNFAFFEADISDPRCFEPSAWILSVRSNVAETTLISRVPDLIRVSSRELIGRVASFALSGAPLSHLPVPPTSIPSGFGELYFSIDQRHRFFDAIKHFRSVGISVPAALPNTVLKLFVVVEKTV